MRHSINFINFAFHLKHVLLAIGMKSDIEIARACRLKPVEEIARMAQMPLEALEYYGKHIAVAIDKGKATFTEKTQGFYMSDKERETYSRIREKLANYGEITKLNVGSAVCVTGTLIVLFYLSGWWSEYGNFFVMIDFVFVWLFVILFEELKSMKLFELSIKGIL